MSLERTPGQAKPSYIGWPEPCGGYWAPGRSNVSVQGGRRAVLTRAPALDAADRVTPRMRTPNKNDNDSSNEK